MLHGHRTPRHPEEHRAPATAASRLFGRIVTPPRRGPVGSFCKLSEWIVQSPVRAAVYGLALIVR